jgi:hypothetical protein
VRCVRWWQPLRFTPAVGECPFRPPTPPAPVRRRTDQVARLLKLAGRPLPPAAPWAGTPKCGTHCVPKRPAVETVCEDEYEAEEQSAAAPQSAIAPQVGSYAAPPPVGEVIGESRSWGMRGLSITLPEVRLELPSVQLPSLVRGRRGPEMQIERSRAPYVTQQAAVYGQMSPGGVPLMASPDYSRSAEESRLLGHLTW